METGKMIQVLGAFGLLDFTMLRHVLVWGAFWFGARFETYETFLSSIFQICFRTR
jgi:hypothetical protein